MKPRKYAGKNVVEIEGGFIFGLRQPKSYDGGWLRNCQIMPRDGEDVLFSTNGDGIRPYLDGYAIIPVEEYNRLKALSG